LGTATITTAEDAERVVYFLVKWTNHGSFLKNWPRVFYSRADALAWCRQQNLRVI